MSKNNIELRKNPNGGAWLNYWDSIHGNDVIIAISESGNATIDDKPCDLAKEILKLASLLNEDL